MTTNPRSTRPGCQSDTALQFGGMMVTKLALHAEASESFQQTYYRFRGSRFSQVNGSDELGINDRNTRVSPVTPYETKNGKEDRLRLRTSFTICELVLRKWPAEPGDALMCSIALSTSARNRKPSRGEIFRY
jgi:hypothetical protein